MKIKRPKNVNRASFRYGIQIAAEVASDYDRYNSHPYLVSECILGKLNVLKGNPKKNPNHSDLEKYRAALKNIFQVLGPGSKECGSNKCDGCKHEIAEATEIARKALKIAK